MKGEQHQIKKATAAMGKKLKAEQMADKFMGMLDRAINKGATPKDVMGLDDAMIEGIYGHAYRLYNTGKYLDAIKLFRLLMMLNTIEPKFAMGLAACFHMIKDYKAATDTYNIVSVLDGNNPVPLYHASDCYIQLGDPISAVIALEMSVRRAGDKPEFKILKDRALLTIASLKKKIEQEDKIKL